MAPDRVDGRMARVARNARLMAHGERFAMVFGEGFGRTPESTLATCVYLDCTLADDGPLASLKRRARALLDGGTDPEWGTFRGETFWDPTGDSVLEMTPEGLWRMKCGWTDWEWTGVTPIDRGEFETLLDEGAITVNSPADDPGVFAFVFTTFTEPDEGGSE